MSCMLDKQGYMHAQAHTRARAQANTRASTHTQIYNISCFYLATMIRERASMCVYFEYTHMASETKYPTKRLSNLQPARIAFVWFR